MFNNSLKLLVLINKIIGNKKHKINNKLQVNIKIKLIKNIQFLVSIIYNSFYKLIRLIIISKL